MLQQSWGNTKPRLGARINWAHPLARNLVGCWLMNEGGGLIANDIALKNHGTLTNGPTWAAGKFGRAIYCDGVTGYISIPDIEENLSKFAAFIWLNTTDAIGTIGKHILCHYQTTTTMRSWGILLPPTTWTGATGSELGVILSDDGTIDAGHVKCYWGSGAGDTIADGAWHLIGFTWNAGILNLYRDGKLLTVNKYQDGSFTTVKNPSSSLSIGASNPDSGGANFVNGLIDNPCIYNRALTAAEIQQLYCDPFCFIERPRLWIPKVGTTDRGPMRGVMREAA